MMKKLLRKNINPWQLVGYGVASLIGLSIIMLAMMFYLDVRTVVSDDAEDELERDYLTLTKPVGMVNLSSDRTCFTQEEIDDLRAQHWVKRVGEFKASDFEVSAAVQFGQRSMSTALFFESVPDEFIDIDTHGWTFNPNNPIINIILPKDYLALYNFGFASSQGLPQVGESLLSNIPMQVTISGNGRSDTYTARIIGFSTRINTVAVPAALIEWAHGIYGKSVEQKMPSRLIVEVSAKGDPAIKEYLDANHYETAKDNANDGKMAYILSVITAVVIAIGAIITALAFFILTLSLYLLLERNHEMLHKLMLLGYSPSRVGSYYYVMVAIINTVVCLGAIAVLLVISPVWETQLEAIGMTSVSPVSIILSGIAFTFVMTIVNILIIRTRIRSYFS